MSEVGSNKHLLQQIFWLILLEYIEKWVLLLKYIFCEKTVLLLRYRGRRSSPYFILMQYKLKCFNQMRRLLFSVQWAMPIRKWFILLSQFC